MNILNEKIPAYMYEKSNLIRLVFFTALFALIFINLYKPFSSESWYRVSDFMFFVYSSLVILTGVLVVVGSRIILFYYAKKHDISYAIYAVWVLAEILFMSLFYTIYTLFLNPGSDVLDTFQSSTINTSLVLLLPYTILFLYFSRQDKSKQLERIEDEKPGEAPKFQLLLFHDEKGELRLSIQRSSLLYIESADNYVIIWYLNKNTPTRFMLRSTLKALETQLSEARILRCHRSFMVNSDQIKVIRREKDGISLDLGIDNIPNIPISKTYSENVTQWLTNNYN
jgi:hypothetical protein